MRHKLVSILAAVLIIFIGPFLSAAQESIQEEKQEENEIQKAAKLLAEVWYFIENHSLEEHQLGDCLTDILKGGLSKCLDAYSAYLTAEDISLLREEQSGKFIGIGIEMVKKENQFLIVAPITGSPAEKEGIKAGDIIVEVEGASVENATLEETRRLIHGPKGSEVKLKILRNGRLIDFKITRQEITVSLVKAEMIGNLGYLRIALFSEKQLEDLIAALEKLTSENEVAGFIADLRNNPGGNLREVLISSALFSKVGDQLLVMRGRQSETKGVVKEKGLYFGRPLVILVNKGSASASEIMAGFLQDAGYAKVIGVGTFGKGIVQTIFPLFNGAVLKMTTHQYFVGPNEKKVNGVGITPDIEVPLNISPDSDARYQIYRRPMPEYDNQLNKAIEVLNSEIEKKKQESEKQ